MSKVNLLLLYLRLGLTQISLKQRSKELLVRQGSGWNHSPQEPGCRVIELAINWGICCGLSAKLDLDNTIPYEFNSGGSLCSLMISLDKTMARASLDDTLFPTAKVVKQLLNRVFNPAVQLNTFEHEGVQFQSQLNNIKQMFFSPIMALKYGGYHE